MERRLARELLDDLPAEDPRAIRSRKDLRKLNAVMRHAELLTAAFRSLNEHEGGQRRIAELGAGDGTLMLRVAGMLGRDWEGTTVTMVDQRSVVRGETEHSFKSLGWEVRSETADVFEWLKTTADSKCDIIVCNLFLHHFANPDLRELLGLVAQKARALIALEPRRGNAPLFFSRLVGLIGCNGVTRHDAVASVRAGFAGEELSRLWPDPGWKLEERCARHTSHLFIARRIT
jgi:hypothetical protein